MTTALPQKWCCLLKPQFSGGPKSSVITTLAWRIRSPAPRFPPEPGVSVLVWVGLINCRMLHAWKNSWPLLKESTLGASKSIGVRRHLWCLNTELCLKEATDRPWTSATFHGEGWLGLWNLEIRCAWRQWTTQGVAVHQNTPVADMTVMPMFLTVNFWLDWLEEASLCLYL